VAANVLAWGCGGLNVDGCRVGCGGGCRSDTPYIPCKQEIYGSGLNNQNSPVVPGLGRFPANLIHDGSEEVRGLFPDVTTGNIKPHKQRTDKTKCQFNACKDITVSFNGDSGSASRFFQACPYGEADIPALLYFAKADRAEREKGLDGMQEVSKADRMGNSSAHGNHNPVCQNCGKSKFDRGKGECSCAEPEWKALNCVG
jgi:hypothetical protein